MINSIDAHQRARKPTLAPSETRQTFNHGYATTQTGRATPKTPCIVVASADFSSQLAAVLDMDGPCLCDVILDQTQGFEPRMSSRKLPDGSIVTPPLEDMFPFLARDELEGNRWPADDGASDA